MTNRVVEIVQGDVSDFAKEIDQSITRSTTGQNVSLGQFGASAMAAGQALALKRMLPVSLSSCDLVFRPGGIEYDEWAAALLLMARSAELLRRKARDGQCYVHRQPCQEARKEESQIYNACLDSFQTLLNEMKSRKIEDPD